MSQIFEDWIILILFQKIRFFCYVYEKLIDIVNLENFYSFQEKLMEKILQSSPFEKQMFLANLRLLKLGLFI